MTAIDCVEAAKHWSPEKEGEIGFLKAVQFVALDLTDNNEPYISLSGDEEGNYDTKLTAKAARYVAKELLELAILLETKKDQVTKELKQSKLDQEKEWERMREEMQAQKLVGGGDLGK